ncbi:response regulator transcription factor [bacterium]|nr:response regulator transcription factor [bacterium]
MTAPKKILIIDDNPKFLEDALPLYDYEVETASDGLKAMKILSKKSDFDIILLDVMMPNMSGWEVLKEIRQNENTKEIPIIMITAINDETKIVKGLKEGADDYVVKPFVLPNLLARIEAVLRRCSRTKTDSTQINIKNIKQSNNEITKKESAVLEFLTKGLTNKEIAEKLNIAELTVKTHLRNIYKKLNVNNRTQLVLMSMQLNSK